MKKYTTLLLFLLVGSFAIAQSSTSKEEKPRQRKELTEQDYLDILASFETPGDEPTFDLYYAIGNAQMYLMRSRDNNELINFFDKASAYAKRTNQLKEYVDLKSNKAQMLISNGNPAGGIEIIDSLILTQEIEISMLARFHKAKGDAYSSLENLAESERNYFKGISISEQIKDTFNIGICYISLASLHASKGNVYDAIDYNMKGLNILEKTDNDYLVTGACNVLCNIFQDLGNHEKAQEYAERMDQLCEKNGYKQFGAYAKSSLGRQAKKIGEYDKALEYYRLAIKELERKGIRIHGSHNIKSAFKVKTDIVEVYLKKGDYSNAKSMLKQMEEQDISSYSTIAKMGYYEIQLESAIADKNTAKMNAYLTKAKEILTDESSFELKKINARLNKLAAEYTGNYKEANAHLNTFFALKDSIEKKQKSQLIHNLEAKYQKAEQEKEITKLSFENERAESQLKQKNVALILGGIGLAILSFLVFQFYKLYQTNKQNKEQLASQNVIVTKALEDKNTLLKEIHHRVKNNLQVISSLLSLQSRYIKDEETLDAIKAGKSRVQSMSLLHQNLYRDDNLKGVEMNQYFQNLGQNLFDTYNIEENIQFTTDIDDITLDIDTVVPMGLITNELISNALKHAFKGRESGKIHLSLKEEADSLLLTVHDDGVGLPDGELPVSYKSLGATLIQSFAEKLEGEIKIDISNGSSVTVVIKDFNKIK